MALATQCPHCGTVFRVAADQLKLRGGMVRCGKCRQVFDGNAALVDVSLLKAQQEAAAQGVTPVKAPHGAEVAPAPQAAPAPEAAPATPQPEPETFTLDFDLSLPPLPEPAAPLPALPEPPQLIIDFDLDLEPPAAPVSKEEEEAAPAIARPHPAEAQEEAAEATPEPAEVAAEAGEVPAEAAAVPAEVAEEPAEAAESPGEAAGVPVEEPAPEPEAEPTPGMAAAPAHEEPIAPAEPEDAHAAELVPSVVASETVHAASALPAYSAEEDIEEPGFVTRVRRKEKLSRVSRVLMAIGSVLLLAALAAQAAITFGSLLAAKYPPLKPALVTACSVLQCRITLPERIDALAVETGELQTLGGDSFSFATVLRNQGTLVQAWPHLELSLTDASDVTLVRRVIAPREYLPARTDIAKGFAPRSEQSIKVYFELSQVKASGYKIAIFYP